jgi:hypothetical protein
MEPLDENELNQLLSEWRAPSPPATLKDRVFRGQRAGWWWKWLLTGSVRVPVPVALAVVLLIALWIHYSKPAVRPTAAQPPSVSLTDFEPVRQLQPVVLGREK